MQDHAIKAETPNASLTSLCHRVAGSPPQTVKGMLKSGGSPTSITNSRHMHSQQTSAVEQRQSIGKLNGGKVKMMMGNWHDSQPIGGLPIYCSHDHLSLLIASMESGAVSNFT